MVGNSAHEPEDLGCGDAMRKIISISVSLLITLMVTGCASHSPQVLTVPLPSAADKIVQLLRRVSVEGVPVNMEYNHPHDFGGATIKNELGLLVVRKFDSSKFGIGSKWLSRPVFPKAGAERLIPALVIAFKEASRSDTILFDIPGRGGQSTSGEVYLKDDKLVWIFKEIDGVAFLGTDPLMPEGKHWTIEEKPGLIVKENNNARFVKVIHDLSVKLDITPETTEGMTAGQSNTGTSLTSSFDVGREDCKNRIWRIRI